jgi:hypothetical protein
MLDTDTFNKENPDLVPKLDTPSSIKTDLRPPTGDDTYDMTDEQALLSPAYALGFYFEDKLWALYMIRGCEETKWSETKREEPQIEGKRKDVIMRLVTNHYPAIDVLSIKKKGAGLIFLLYGLSGSGKTLTVGKSSSIGVEMFFADACCCCGRAWRKR